MDDLYALPPEQFTAARDAAAKADKADKALKALRRPTVSAWLVNLLLRQERDLVEQLLSVGVELAAAQRGGDAAALRSLGEQRRSLVEAVVDRAVELAGRSVTAAVRSEVAGTLEAALADAGSAEAVRSGRLIRPLSYAGFGGVDLSGAVAPTTTKPRSRTAPPPPKPAARQAAGRLHALEKASLAAAGALDDAVAAARTATAGAAGLRVQADEAQARSEAAVAEVELAQQAAEEARAALDEARRG